MNATPPQVLTVCLGNICRSPTAEAAIIEAAAEADLVVVMDRQNLADVQRLATSAQVDTPIRLLRAFDVASLERGDLEVPDLYQGGPAGFALVVEQCRAAAAGVVAHLAGHRSDPGPR